MSDHKIIIAGPVGAGKSTAVAALSDIEPIRTDARPSDMVARQKDSTTVAMDYGRIDLDGSEHVHLYGTPGQERFDFMWEILSKGAIGLIILVGNNSAAPVDELMFFIKRFSKLIAESRFVVGVSHMDECHHVGLTDYQDALERLGYCVPIFEVDARSKQDMRTLLKALLYFLDPGLMEPRSAA